LLFLRDDPWRVVCPQQSPAEVVEGYDLSQDSGAAGEAPARVAPLPRPPHQPPDPYEAPLWSGDTLPAVAAGIRAALATPTPA